jgi:hypothetical protein
MNNEALISARPIDPALREQILGCLQRERARGCWAQMVAHLCHTVQKIEREKNGTD